VLIRCLLMISSRERFSLNLNMSVFFFFFDPDELSQLVSEHLPRGFDIDYSLIVLRFYHRVAVCSLTVYLQQSVK
jgi:hypothetical protein